MEIVIGILSWCVILFVLWVIISVVVIGNSDYLNPYISVFLFTSFLFITAMFWFIGIWSVTVLFLICIIGLIVRGIINIVNGKI